MRGFLRDQRGVALLDTIVACAILAVIVVATASAYGARPVRPHAAAMALEAAMAEARSLAAANDANANNPNVPTGATVIVQPDPAMTDATQIAVYNSRAVVIGGNRPYAPTPDAGFPPQRVFGTFTFVSGPTGTPTTSIAEPFEIMLSGSGYASVTQITAPYNAAAPPTFATDPGCPASNAQIAVNIGTPDAVRYPFSCTGGEFVAN